MEIKEATEVLRLQIMEALDATTGQLRDCSVEQAAALSGVGAPTIYQLKRGDLIDHDTLCRHLVALLNVPAFAERYMTLQGYSCAFVGNEEEVCEWSVTAAIGEACGETAECIRDGRWDHREKAHLATKIIPKFLRKAVAYVAQHARRRAMGVAS